MKKNKTKKVRKPVQERQEGFAPMLLAAVCSAVALIVTVINKYIFSYGQEILSPLIAQIIILLIPTYILITLTLPQKNIVDQTKELGVRRFQAKHIFFTLYTAFFAITTSLIINMLFGGFYSIKNGFALLGAFRAGENEFSVSSIYLIVTYALIPALVEELVFRGFLFNHLKKIGAPVAFIASSIIYALFFFSPLQIPAAFVIGMILSFVFITTDSLLTSMLVHFVFNLFALFWQTNFSQYFISTNKKILPIVIAVAAWLLSCVLFFGESARIYKARADEVTDSSDISKPFKFTALWREIRALFSYKPTLVASIIFAVTYIIISVIGMI